LAAVGNQFVLFEDKPINEDAWNVEVYHLEKRREVGRPQTSEYSKVDRFVLVLKSKSRLATKHHWFSNLTGRGNLPG